MSCCLRMERIEPLGIPASFKSLSVSDCAVEWGCLGRYGEAAHKLSKRSPLTGRGVGKAGENSRLAGPFGEPVALRIGFRKSRYIKFVS